MIGENDLVAQAAAADDIGVEQVVVVVQHRDLFARHLPVGKADLLPEHAVAGVLDKVQVIAEVQPVGLDERGKFAAEAFKIGKTHAPSVDRHIGLIVRQRAINQVLDRIGQQIADAEAVDVAHAHADELLADEIVYRSLCHKNTSFLPLAPAQGQARLSVP